MSDKIWPSASIGDPAFIAAQREANRQLSEKVERLTRDNDRVEFVPNSEIKSPAHYTQGGIQPIDFIVSNKMCFRQGNVIKYVTRYKHKGTPLQDLLKARQYLNWLIEEEDNIKPKEKHD